MTSRKDFVRSLGLGLPLALAAGSAAVLDPKRAQAQSLPEVFNVKDPLYGAVGDGIADDTAAINACIQAAMSVGVFGPNHLVGGIVYFPRGLYRVTNTIEIHGVRGLIVTGEGHAGSVISWDGGTDTTKAIISLDGSHNTISNLYITTKSQTDKVGAALRICKQITGTWISTANHIEDVSFGIAGKDSWLYGVDITNQSAPTGATGNNECHRFVRCSFTAYSEAAVHMFGSQAHAMRFEDCEMTGNGNPNGGKYGVYCEYGAYIHWQGGSGGYHTEADFYLLGGFYILSTITGWNSEQSRRLIKVGNANTGAALPLTIKGCRFESNNIDPEDTGDEYIIWLNSPGPTSIEGCTFSSAAQTPRIRVGGLAEHQLIKLDGNVFIGAQNYPRAKIPAPDGGVSWHGPLRIANNPRIADEGNLYWNYNLNAHEWIALPRAISVRGLGTKEAGEAARNFAGSMYFSNVQSLYSQMYSGAEADADYLVFCTIEHAYGNVPEDLSVVVSDKQDNRFLMTLSEPAIGFAVRVNWMIVRT